MITWQGREAHLEPEFAGDIDGVCSGLPFDWRVFYGYRSMVLQASLRERYLADPEHAPKAAAAGQSAHNYGLAVDLQLIVAGALCWDFTHAGWLALFDAVAKHPRLHSGRSFADDDHVEKVNWRHFVGWAAKEVLV